LAGPWGKKAFAGILERCKCDQFLTKLKIRIFHRDRCLYREKYRFFVDYDNDNDHDYEDTCSLQLFRSRMLLPVPPAAIQGRRPGMV